MKFAVIKTGGKQYLVSEGDTLDIDFLTGKPQKTVDFTPLMTLNDDKVNIGKPEIKEAKVTAEVLDPMFKGEKVLSIRYKAKKRVNKTRGHRQQYTKIKINKIS